MQFKCEEKTTIALIYSFIMGKYVWRKFQCFSRRGVHTIATYEVLEPDDSSASIAYICDYSQQCSQPQLYPSNDAISDHGGNSNHDVVEAHAMRLNATEHLVSNHAAIETMERTDSSITKVFISYNMVGMSHCPLCHFYCYLTAHQVSSYNGNHA